MSISTVHPHQRTCPIIQLNVRPYQRQNNSISWYPVKVELYTNHCFEIKYRYSQFIQFSRNIHQRYNISKKDLPVLKKENYYYNFLKKGNQKYIDRQTELEKFCKKLLSLPSNVTCSGLFLSFFSEMCQVATTTTLEASTSTLKRVFSLRTSPVPSYQSNSKPTSIHNPSNQYDDFELSRSTTVTVSCMSPLLQYQSMISTTTSRSSTTSSMLFSSSLSSEEDSTIKLKIVYDCNNIVIIRVPRSISLDQLRSQVIQKFALLNIQLPDQLILISSSSSENVRSSSASSIICSDPDVVTLISQDEQFSKAMQTKWSCLQKVTLRCMV